MVDVLIAVVDWFSAFSTGVLGIGGDAFTLMGSSGIGEALGDTTIDYGVLSS